MIKQQVEQLIQAALDSLQAAGQLSGEFPRIQLDTAKDKQHGDFASNIALALAKSAQKKPRELAEMIVQALPSSSIVNKVEIAGPGFINFFLSPTALFSVLSDIHTAGVNYGRSDVGRGQRILLEFVSSNPTGPLHVGHGRHAAYGAVVADLLEIIGFSVHREYYVNDAGRQMDILAVSVWLRYLALYDEEFIFPVNAYKGDYVITIASLLQEKYAKQFYILAENIFKDLPLDECAGGDKEIYIDAVILCAKKLLGEENYNTVLNFALENILADIRDDLTQFGVVFQEWFSERAFTKTDIVDRVINQLQQADALYTKDGALWFRATDYGDEKDRVLQRSNGQRTYFANDIAYHVYKFERGFDRAITILGSDHHGYVPRMKAGMKASGIQPDRLIYPLMQLVTLYRSGIQAQMSTRSGSFVTLRELREEVGNDAARFFYVMRKCEQPVDFDLDLAKSKSNENPVYYIQYAHARVCSVFRQLAEKNLFYQYTDDTSHFVLLTQPHELQLLGTLSRYCAVLLSAAMQYEPHILTNYLRELANDFHGYYNSHQFLVDDAALRNARLTLISATRQVLVNGLKLLGISAPDRM